QVAELDGDEAERRAPRRGLRRLISERPDGWLDLLGSALLDSHHPVLHAEDPLGVGLLRPLTPSPASPSPASPRRRTARRRAPGAPGTSWPPKGRGAGAASRPWHRSRRAWRSASVTVPASICATKRGWRPKSSSSRPPSCPASS